MVFAMEFRLTPWTGPAAPGGAEIKALLRGEGLHPYSWSNAPGYRYAAHSHDYTKILYCLSGSIVFHVGGGSVDLEPGDRLQIEAGVMHSADVGPQGVVCLEAARRAP